MSSGEGAQFKLKKSAADAAQTSDCELWVRVESRSRPGRFYWTTTDGLRSQWTRPAARKIVPPTNVAGNLGKLPGDALNLILADYCDPAAAARVSPPTLEIDLHQENRGRLARVVRVSVRQAPGTRAY